MLITQIKHNSITYQHKQKFTVVEFGKSLVEVGKSLPNISNYIKTHSPYPTSLIFNPTFIKIITDKFIIKQTNSTI